jgi:hypothetical protein
MGLLDGLMGALGQGGASDFIQRYERGAPWDGVSDQEASQHYERVAGALPASDYRQAAEDAFQRLSPDQRRDLHAHLEDQARRQDFNVPSPLPGTQQGDPGALADLAAHLHGSGPGVLQGLLGGGAGGAFSHPLAKAALAGIAAMAMKRAFGNRR